MKVKEKNSCGYVFHIRQNIPQPIMMKERDLIRKHGMVSIQVHF